MSFVVDGYEKTSLISTKRLNELLIGNNTNMQEIPGTAKSYAIFLTSKTHCWRIYNRHHQLEIVHEHFVKQLFVSIFVVNILLNI